LQAIKECRLPAKLVAKLRLEFPRARRRRKYGAVPPFHRGQEDEKAARKRRRNEGDTNDQHDVEHQVEASEKEAFLSGRRHREERERAGPSEEKAKDESGSEDDDDTCEEWERHEALHDDVQARRGAVPTGDPSQQPGTKERLFEEEMEVTWEKGGSGLVFYTDAQVWKEAEGDFDEQTADDWDVDVSVYYEENGGDKDAKDSLAMRESVFLRKRKHHESVFRKKEKREDEGKIGAFERHTRGFGRRIMERQGWRDGQGLGGSKMGMAEALHNDGQTNRAGLGYYGEALERPSAEQKAKGGRKRQTTRDVIISTAYDQPAETDPGEKLARVNPQNYLKFRK